MAAVKINETWIRPWKGELIVGQVVALSGGHAICRTANGFEFRVDLGDIYAGKVDLFNRQGAMQVMSPRAPFRTLTGLRLSEKAMTS